MSPCHAAAHAYMTTADGHNVLSMSRQRNLIIGHWVCYVVCCNEKVFGEPLCESVSISLLYVFLLLNELEYDCIPVCMPFTNPVGFVMSWLCIKTHAHDVLQPVVHLCYRTMRTKRM